VRELPAQKKDIKMSYRWPNKDPDETLDYSVDWSRFLGDTSTIQSVAWFIDNENGVKTPFEPVTVVNGLQPISTTNTTTASTIFLGLGTNNKVYKIYCRMTDTMGRVAERSITLSVKER
jgi:hypothetical protein